MIQKNAGAIEETVKTFLGKLDPKTWISKPFETIFSTMGPMIIWKIFGAPLGLLSLVGQHYGIGLSYFGKLIDGKLIKNGKVDLSEQNLESSSKEAVDDFLKSTNVSEACDFLNDLKIVKSSLNENDFITALYVSNGMQKTAIRSGIVARFLKIFQNGKGKIAITGAIYAIIKMIGKGIIAAAATAGVISMVSGHGLKETKETKTPGEKTQTQGRTSYYSNVAKNVEDTLIKFLDSTIIGFSDTFLKIYKTTLKDSKQLNEILNEVEQMNGTAIEEINRWDAFTAPQIFDIAKKLMPQAIYEKIQQKEKIQPQVQDPKERLKKLLSEV